ncbi:unnamed protein product [Protopolystoma xenopodis]|uniref:Uncharacterized protein n=1 Tax=Protopolystoma xenopodis TaxID=117903 RepID=A0A3S5BNV8_9PLAT|nr:unnamed protein product [Protopolystoma xenopodis]
MTAYLMRKLPLGWTTSPGTGSFGTSIFANPHFVFPTGHALTGSDGIVCPESSDQMMFGRRPSGQGAAASWKAGLKTRNWNKPCSHNLDRHVSSALKTTDTPSSCAQTAGLAGRDYPIEPGLGKQFGRNASEVLCPGGHETISFKTGPLPGVRWNPLHASYAFSSTTRLPSKGVASSISGRTGGILKRVENRNLTLSTMGSIGENVSILGDTLRLFAHTDRHRHETNAPHPCSCRNTCSYNLHQVGLATGEEMLYSFISSLCTRTWQPTHVSIPALLASASLTHSSSSATPGQLSSDPPRERTICCSGLVELAYNLLGLYDARSGSGSVPSL